MSGISVSLATDDGAGEKRTIGVAAGVVWCALGEMTNELRKLPDGGKASFGRIYKRLTRTTIDLPGRHAFLEYARQLAGGHDIEDETGIVDKQAQETDGATTEASAEPSIPPPAPEPELTEFEKSAMKSAQRLERLENTTIMFSQHINPLLEELRLLRGAYPKVLPYTYATMREGGVEAHYVLLVTVVRKVLGRIFELKCIIDEDCGPSAKNGMLNADNKVVRYAHAKNEPDPITGDSIWISPIKLEEGRLIRYYGKFLGDNLNDEDYDCRYVVRNNSLVRVTNVKEWISLTQHRKTILAQQLHGIPRRL